MEKEISCCSPGSSCKVEALISVDERGQMVFPKDVRDRAGIKPGDKLALVSWGSGDEICCMFLIKSEELAVLVKNMLGPVVKEIVK